MAKRHREADAIVLAVTSDQHCGSTVALHQPSPTPRDDGGEYNPSRAQRWLYQCWSDYWQRVERLREEWGAGLFNVFNGDLVDGPAHHGTTQTVAVHPGAEKYIAKKCLELPRSLSPDRQFVVRGTEVHVGKSGCAEDTLAEWMGAEPDPETDAHSWWHLRLELQGLLFDFQHHGRVGQRPWTKYNVTALLAAQIFYEHAARGERHPDIAFRSHYHQHIDTAGAHPTRVIQTPAFQLHTAFTRKVVAESRSDIGGVIVLVRDGSIAAVEAVKFTPALAKPWTGSK